MTDQHPITPPRALLNQWMTEGWHQDYCSNIEFVAARSAQWSYEQRGEVNEAELQQARDEELEACCELLKQKGVPAWSLLRSHRRPKPPSLKEQALEEVGAFEGMGTCNIDIIRRALETLPDKC